MRPGPTAFILAALLAGQPLQAQSADPAPPPEEASSGQPVLRVDFPETEAVPGQFLTLRLTVLVPSFMTAPPVWPGFEAPNLLVRVPEGGTSPVSERIDGDTWSGISRRYRISPMLPGAFALPAQEVVVTWADATADGPVRTTLSTGALALSGVLPEAAEGLDPFVAASDLSLTQQIAGDPSAMVPGDSITRTITVEVAGVSPMFLPALLPPGEVAGLAAYPDTPVVEETENRGQLAGSRVESVTYVAEGGGSGTLPEVVLQWFDIDTGTVETARADAVAIAVDGPPAVLADPDGRLRLAMLAAAGVAFAALLALCLRLVLPSLRRRVAARRAARLASESHAWRALAHVVARRDHATLHPALDLWAARTEGRDPRRDPDVQKALATLGRARYGSGNEPTTSPDDAWRALDGALRAVRRPANAGAHISALPPLNPGATT
ncbi:hypothetical protein ACRDNQ_06960 [Palleronia sp. KMU-117]|uniref:hypothetical protein n=1 Tax=Palleronia sp. KMU-117 TaxID=3434108 RepID=UPI003D702987